MHVAFPLQQWLHERAFVLYVIRTMPVLLNYTFISICYSITVSLNHELCLSCPVTSTWAAIMIPQIK